MKLHQRGNTYHLRLRVPADLVPVIGRREIHQSLRTSNHRTASSRANQIKASVLNGFESLRLARLSVRNDEELSDLANGFLTKLGSTRRNREIRFDAQKPLRLRELQDLHLKEKQTSLDPRSYDKMCYSYHLALHHIGNIALRDLDRSVCRSYRDALQHGHQFELRADNASKRTDRALSVKSVNHHLQYLSGLLRWATREEIMPGNPAEGLTLRKNLRESDERFAFNDDQLQKLLGSLWRDEHRADRKWIPLVALWSGMRQEEICQLRHCDVVYRDGVYAFEVTGEAGSVKSMSAERLVPIHPWLIERGFLKEVWSEQKTRSDERLWPTLKKTRLGRYSNSLCKWFSRYKRMKGFDDKRYCFHSLRHTFINVMKQNDVPEPVIRQIVGHRETSITLGRYGKDYDLKKLNDYIKTVTFDLSL
jgi:integrase